MSAASLGSEPLPAYRANFPIRLEDYVAATRLLQRGLNLGGVILGLVISGIGVATIAITDATGAGVLALAAGLGLVFLAMTPFLDRWRGAREARSVLGQQATFEIGADGIDSSMSTGSSHMPWSAATHVVSNERVMVIMRDRIPLAWLPTSAFTAPGEADSVLAFMRARIAAQARHVPDAA